MKVALTADLHGYLPDVPECDVLLIVGDVCPNRDHSRRYQEAWLKEPFAEWLDELAVSGVAVIGVGGNHDFALQFDKKLGYSLPWYYLKDETVGINGLKIHGSPWSVSFGSWAFMMEESKLREKWRLIPDELDVLMVHGPPQDYCDLTSRGDRAGSRTLTERLQEIDVRIVVCGHIHEARGFRGNVDNVSFVDLKYVPYEAGIEVVDL